MYSFEYECPSCQHQGNSKSLRFGYFCPECNINVPEALHRRNFEQEVVARTVRAITLISGLVHPSRIEIARRKNHG
jgi:hypothetical protein